jgi:predicted NACHT family NTPase
MQKADYLLRLMKQRTDALVASDKKLQQFLMWVNEKSLSVKVPHKPGAVRAFYFALDCELDPALVRSLDRSLERDPETALDRTLDRALDLGLARVERSLADALVGTLDLALYRADTTLHHALERSLESALNRAIHRTLDPELWQALQQLKTQLPEPDSAPKIFKQWWKAKGRAWTEQLRVVMINHRNIGHDWQFSKEQKELLKQYNDANVLLVDCLNSDCNVTPAVRSHIEKTLLLPIALIEKTGSCQDK